MVQFRNESELKHFNSSVKLKRIIIGWSRAKPNQIGKKDWCAGYVVSNMNKS